MYHKHNPEENIIFEAFINMFFLVFFYNKGCIDELNVLYVFLISDTSLFTCYLSVLETTMLSTLSSLQSKGSGKIDVAKGDELLSKADDEMSIRDTIETCFRKIMHTCKILNHIFMHWINLQVNSIRCC